MQQELNNEAVVGPGSFGLIRTLNQMYENYVGNIMVDKNPPPQ